jgi:hypothetical protein
MGIERFLIGNPNNYTAMFNNIKSWFEENMPNFFDNIVVDDSLASSSYNNRGAVINFYENEEIIKSIISTYPGNRNLDVRYSRLLFKSKTLDGYYTKPYGANDSNVSDNWTLMKDSSSPEYCNCIYEIMKISENIVAFSLCNNVELDFQYRRPGVVIFMKTHDAEIATVNPSLHYAGTHVNNNTFLNNTKGTQYNYLQVITKNMTSSVINLPYGYESKTGTKTCFTPIALPNDDYLPHTSILQTSSSKLQTNSDCTIKIGMREFYYNGVIAIELQ